MPYHNWEEKVKREFYVLAALIALILFVGCGSKNGTAVPQQTDQPQPADPRESPASPATPDLVTDESSPVCRQANGEGTIAPAISIFSIAFVVNGVEQVVLVGEGLTAQPGDEVQVREVTVCADTVSDAGGKVCVDFAPVTYDGRKVVSENIGTHTTRVRAGFFNIPGPKNHWIIDKEWMNISGVVNHWPTRITTDKGCGSGRCEHDDWIDIEFQ